MNKKEQVLLEKPDVKKAEDVEKKAGTVEVFIMGKSYKVPAGLTIMKALEYAGNEGAITVGLTGFGGGQLKDIADKCIVLSSHDYGQVEDVHLCLAHITAYLVREKSANG